MRLFDPLSTYVLSTEIAKAAPRFLAACTLPVHETGARHISRKATLDINDCWFWNRSAWTFQIAGRIVSIRDFSYVWRTGPVPLGLIPRPICQTRDCIRFDHLRLHRKHGAGGQLTGAEVAAVRAVFALRPEHAELNSVAALARAYDVTEFDVELIRDRPVLAAVL